MKAGSLDPEQMDSYIRREVERAEGYWEGVLSLADGRAANATRDLREVDDGIIHDSKGIGVENG